MYALPDRPALLRFLLGLAACLPLLAQTAQSTEEVSSQEILYQDFRGTRPLLSDLTLEGPDADTAVKPEEEGLRITLPATRTKAAPVGVVAGLSLSGDFEITGRYQLIFADQPTRGNGVGVALNLASNSGLRKFAKVGQFHRPAEKNVFLTEYWDKDQPGSYQLRSVPTEVRSGQLRLVRERSLLRFLVAEGLEGDFQEIWQVEFGDGELSLLRFVANNSGSPAGIDARLVDWKIRYNRPAVLPGVDLPQAWLAIRLFLGMGIVLILLLVLSLWLYLRRRKRAVTDPSAVATPRQ